MNRSIKQVISVVMSLILVFGIAVMPGTAASTDKKPWDSQEVYDEGYVPVTSVEFFEIVDQVNDACDILLGFRLLPEEKLEMTVNGHLNDIFASIKEETNGILDCDQVAHSLPALSPGSKEIKTLLQLDMDVVAPVLNDLAGDCFENDQVIAGFFITLLKMYLLTIESCELYTAPAEGEPGVFDICLAVNFENGTKDTIVTGMIYDSVNGSLTNRDGHGMLGLGFELDTDTNVLTTVVNSWQRNFGFMMTYDIFCYVTKIFDYITERVHFTYDNREWMIQVWKGKYLIAPGGEIGIYNREIGAPTTFYNCASDEDMMVMTMKLYHKDELLLEMEPTLHWWLTGFKFYEKVYVPESLILHGSIQFPTVEMADLFVASAAQEATDMATTQNGATVAFIW